MLKPTLNQVIKVEGKVFYNDRRRRIDIKKPIRDLFEDSSLNVGYVMEMCMTQEKALERVRKLTESNIMPVLMYFNIKEAEDAAVS